MAQSSENFLWQPRDLVGLTAVLELQDQDHISMLEFNESRSESNPPFQESSEMPDQYLLPVPDARSNSGSHITEGFARRLEEDAESYLRATDRNSVIDQILSLPSPQVLVSLPPETTPSIISGDDVVTIIVRSFMALLAAMWNDLSFGFYRMSMVFINNQVSQMVSTQIGGRTISFASQNYIIATVADQYNDFRNELLAYARSLARKYYIESLEHDFTSYPAKMASLSGKHLGNDIYLHQYTDISKPPTKASLDVDTAASLVDDAEPEAPSGPGIQIQHYQNRYLRRFYRQIFILFQKHVPYIQHILLDLSPTGLAFGSMMLYSEARCWVTGYRVDRESNDLDSFDYVKMANHRALLNKLMGTDEAPRLRALMLGIAVNLRVKPYVPIIVAKKPETRVVYYQYGHYDTTTPTASGSKVRGVIQTGPRIPPADSTDRQVVGQFTPVALPLPTGHRETSKKSGKRHN